MSRDHAGHGRVNDVSTDARSAVFQTGRTGHGRRHLDERSETSEGGC